MADYAQCLNRIPPNIGIQQIWIISMPNINYHCHVCGLKEDQPPWGEDNRTPSFEICSCCGVEFGYEDSTPIAIKKFREEWISKGAPWFVPTEKPAEWNLEEQLKNSLS